jgi:DNA-binding CsgD family transcriptional regulator
MLAPPIEDLSALISDIYDCAIEPQRWPATLAKIARLLDAEYAALTLADRSDPNNIKTWRVAPPPWDSQEIRRVNLNFGLETPGVQAVLDGDLDAPYATLLNMDEEVFKSTRFYREWAAPLGLRDACVTKFSDSVDRFGLFTVVTSARRDIISVADCKLIAMLSPHVRRAALIGDLLNHAQIAANSYRSALNVLKTPAFLTDQFGNLKFANSAGASLLAACPGKDDLSGSMLRAAAPEARSCLADAIVRAATSDATELGGHGIGIPLSAPGTAPLIGYVLPLANSDVRGAFGTATVAVFLSTKAQDALPSVAALSGLFDLTPAEARVMLRVGSGAAVGEVAVALGVSENTVKTHLQRVFVKTGTNKQPQLVTLLGSLGAP